MAKKWLAALPVYNEAATVHSVLNQVVQYAPDVLVVDDGSSDGTAALLAQRNDIQILSHEVNRGYGAALASAFQHAIERKYEVVVTLDCDGQHQPKRIPRFVQACKNADIVSGSRYLKKYPGDSEPPVERMMINRQITSELNKTLGLCLTDTFCGFKAYRVSALKQLDLQDTGYAMPLELWVQAAMLGMRIIEIPVPLIYLDLSRSFGGALDQATERLRHYREVVAKSIEFMRARGYQLPAAKHMCVECR